MSSAFSRRADCSAGRRSIRCRRHFKLLGARIVEPHSLAGDPGAIHLWVEALDDDNLPSGAPRAYRLPYDAKLAERTEAAVSASAEGKPQGGRTADFGNGEGGVPDATARESPRLRSPPLAAAIRPLADRWTRHLRTESNSPSTSRRWLRRACRQRIHNR